MKHFYAFLFIAFVCLSLKLQAQNFVRGADVSWLSEMEASGRVWHDSNAVQKDLLDILPDYCINTIRLRVWVNPSNGWSGKVDMIGLAKRAYAKGYRILVDFHYSDSWADPGQQTKPVAWQSYSVAQLEQAVYDHTVEVLTDLKNEGVTPEWVQVGNETNDGMLWPEGRASLNNNANLENYAKFVDSGYEAVKNVFPNAKVIAHVANGYDNGLFRWNIGGLISYGARFDVIGMSMYPDTPADWPQYAADALANMQDMISEYGKEIMVVEIGLATNAPQESRAFVEQVITNLTSLPNDNGLGVLWWEPQAYNWRGYGKVAWNGGIGETAYQATEAMKGFQQGCSQPELDCYGEENGTAYEDDCGNCVGGSTGEIPCSPVNITFKVDMTGQDISNGIYITGAMTETGTGWQIVPMQNEGNGVYALTFTLLPGEEGAYYYLNANNWEQRETVPQECQEWYDLDRGYVVPDQDVILQSAWSSCEEGVITSLGNVEDVFYIAPNPFDNQLTIRSSVKGEYQLININGVLVEEGNCFQSCVVGEQVLSGVYYLQFKCETKVLIKKVIKY